MSDTHPDQLARFGVHIPRLLVPTSDVDFYRWAVIACDQHTSEPDYWEEVDQIVADAPSTLRLVFPEVYLGNGQDEERVESIHATMREYLDDGVLRELAPGLMLTVRSTPHASSRQGLVLAVDLEAYDFTPGARSMIRATEGTIVERLPARVRVREGAPIEVPHVLVLINDPDDILFGSISESDPDQVYSSQLMLGGGSITGYHIGGDDLQLVETALGELMSRSNGSDPFLFAVGDGNHSLAAAKQVWERRKSTVGPDHPARYALVEVVNLFDPGLRFEPIHRLVRSQNREQWLATMIDDIGADYKTCSLDELRTTLRNSRATIGVVSGDQTGLLTLKNRKELPVAVCQDYLSRTESDGVDYIHGWDTSVQLGGGKNSIALLLPEFDAATLFPTVAKRGALPRKAFSLGEAEEKRYYFECRAIDP